MLSQGSIFLKQNPGESHMSVEELKEMLHSKSYSGVMSKLMHYAKNVSRGMTRVLSSACGNIIHCNLFFFFKKIVLLNK